MTKLELPPRQAQPSAVMLTGNSLLRAASVALRAVLTLAMAVWLQPSELGAYALIAATLTLTTYLYGLDFQAFSMRELSTADLGAAKLRLRDQFTLLAVIYAIGTAALAIVLTQLGLEPSLLALILPMAVLQHASLEFYRVFARLGRPISGTVVLLIRDAAWAPLCILTKLVTGDLSLPVLLGFWLLGSLASVLYGAWILIRWLPASERRQIDLAWLASGLRVGLRMLIGTLASVALFTVDRMIFATLASPDELGAYAVFALGCASLQGLFETAILPSFWAPLLQAKQDGNEISFYHAQKKLNQVCLIGAFLIGGSSVVILTVLCWYLPHRAYAENIHLLYYIAAAYSLVTLANVPHYKLYAAQRDREIVTANVAAFALFLLLVGLIVNFDRSNAVPLSLVLACGAVFMIKALMVWGLPDRSSASHEELQREAVLNSYEISPPPS